MSRKVLAVSLELWLAVTGLMQAWTLYVVKSLDERIGRLEATGVQ